MHTGVDYGKQIIPSEYLTESPSAQGFLDPKGQFENKSKRLLYVYDNEGPIPHCHIVGLGPNGKKEVCVRLDKAEYFCHGRKQDKFTAKEKKMFINFINSKDKFGIIRWNWAASTWDGFAQNNENMLEINRKTTPDYSMLETEEDE